MPLLKGKENIGHNVETEEAAGKPKRQAVAIALKTAGVAKARDAQPGMVTQPNAAAPPARRRTADDGSFSATDAYTGRRI